MALDNQQSTDKAAMSDSLFHRLRENSATSLIFKGLQLVLAGAILSYLAYKVNMIGWHAVWDALPTQPLYYILFLMFYFTVPASEYFVYRQIWQRPLRQYFWVFVRKKIYNFAVLSYLGEAYLAYWAKTRLGMSDRYVFSTVKDGNILSSFASNSFTLLLLAVFFLTGQINILIDADPAYENYFAIAAAIGLILMPLIIYFRASIISVSTTVMKKAVLIHVVRVTLQLLLQAAMWATVLPNVPFEMWLLFLTAQMVVSRIPFLPNTDLLFTGLGLTLGAYLDAPEAIIAGMFLASGALSQLLNLLFYILTSFSNNKHQAISDDIEESVAIHPAV